MYAAFIDRRFRPTRQGRIEGRDTLVSSPSILLRGTVSSIILITHRRCRTRTSSQIRICTHRCQSTTSIRTSREVMRRKVGYHHTGFVVVGITTRWTVQITGVSISAHERPVTPSTSIPSVVDTGPFNIFTFLTRTGGRSPIDRVEPVTEFVRGRELPFTDDGPDDNCTTDTGRHDDDGNDGVSGEMT